MKAYVVYWTEDYEGDWVDHPNSRVFLNEERARQYLNDCNQNRSGIASGRFELSELEQE